MSTTVRSTAAGGHTGVRRLILVTAALMAGIVLSVPMNAGDGRQVSAREAKGVYHVAATFEVPQSIATAYAVLTDYEQVPRFMPDIRTSIVRERTPERVLVEQEAVARLMLFAKTVHLLLEVHETPGAIRFRDTSGKSFSHYEGGWTVSALAHPTPSRHTLIAYTLTAKPAFSVPEFMLTRLLKRDAGRMIDGLRAEMATR